MRPHVFAATTDHESEDKPRPIRAGTAFATSIKHYHCRQRAHRFKQNPSNLTDFRRSARNRRLPRIASIQVVPMARSDQFSDFVAADQVRFAGMFFAQQVHIHTAQG